MGERQGREAKEIKEAIELAELYQRVVFEPSKPASRLIDNASLGADRSL